MLTIQKYIRAASLEEAYQLNQKRSSRIIAGMLWTKMSRASVQTAIDLCDLGLDAIEEKDDCFSIGAMATLRQLELHEGLNAYTNGMMEEALRSIVGVQFRNLATVGGSLWGRFGFSDVLTLCMSMDASVELYRGGIVPIEDFARMPYDRDILTRIIIQKTPARFAYRAMRIQKTDIPILTCAAARVGDEIRTAIGARPGRAMLLRAKIPLEENYPKRVAEAVPTGGNSRASAAYRARLTEVLTERCLRDLEEI